MNPVSLQLVHNLLVILLFTFSSGPQTITGQGFSIKEATIDDLQLAFKHNQLTSRQLVQFYLGEITRLNPFLKGVIEMNPDALAEKADYDSRPSHHLCHSLSCMPFPFWSRTTLQPRAS
ncbi:unnamed protein product [Prunus brigantina]